VSEENVRVVRDQYTATNERDFGRAMSHYAEQVEMVVPTGIRAGIFNGRRAVGEWFGDWFGTFDRDAHFDIEEITDLDDSSVLLVAKQRARGRVSGAEIEGYVIWLYRLKAGKIISLKACDSRDDALKAVRLEE
jgi:ketosteroid isomerase-like protein